MSNGFIVQIIGAVVDIEFPQNAVPQVYAVDLICDPEVQPFYEKCGFSSYTGALIRRRERLQR